MSKTLLESDLTLGTGGGPAAVEPRLEPGSRVADKYLVRDTLGHGAFAVVYDALDTERARPVAIKVLHVSASTPLGLVERFRREVRLSSTVRHPHVLEVYETGQLDDGSPYLVMERLAGETLAARIARSPLSVAQAIELGCQLLAAVEAIAEAGIVHRDIKPENVMLHEAGPEGPPRVKLVDFGISKRVAIEPEPRLTSHGALVGTPQYMAPEQIRGEEVDVRTDLYAVGAVLYEALSGKAPHESSNFSELVVAVLGAPVAPIRQARSDCPLELEHVILRALARTPHDRHGSAREFADALEHIARTFGLPRGDAAFQPGNLDIGALVVANSTARSSIVTNRGRLGSRLGKRRPMQLGAMALMVGVPAYALHLYGPSWFERSERVLAQRAPGSELHRDATPPLSLTSTPSLPEAPRPRPPALIPPKTLAEPVTPGVVAKGAPPARAEKKAAMTEEKPEPPAAQPEEAAPIAAVASAPTAMVSPTQDPVAASADTRAQSADVVGEIAREPSVTVATEPVSAGAADEAAPEAPRRTYKQIMEAALAAMVRGKLVEAATRYNEAVRLDPKEPSGFRGLGLVAARLGNHAGARWALTRYLALAPKAPDAPTIAARIAALPPP